MKWSWKLGEVYGIGIYMHVTFLLLLAWVGLSHWLTWGSLEATIIGVTFILMLFGCVVLHELGHSLAARKYGIRTRDITLLPIGGVARLERMPEEPIQEFWVALAGPSVNVVVAIAIYLWLSFTEALQPISQIGLLTGSLLERLMVVNVFLALFNLLPAFPMDGGRVVRALLAMRMEYTRATNIAAALGQGMALLFGFLGLFTNPLLVFIALFVWIGAAQEATMVQVKSALGGIPVSKAMMTDFKTLSPYDRLSRSIDLILAGSQQDFPVVDNGNLVGVLTRDALLASLARQGLDAFVSDVMERDFQTVDSHDMLESAFAQIENCACRTIPVVHGGQLVGLLTKDNVGEFLMIQAALGDRAERSRGGIV
jgi:Zn-dependent protease/predicted transcriptional regulator